MLKKIISFSLMAIALMSCSTVGQAASYQKGDVNTDGIIDVSDVTLIQLYLANENPKNFTMYYADFNGDGQITVNDVSTLQLYIGEQLYLYKGFFYSKEKGNTAVITGYNGTAKNLSIPTYLYTKKNEALKVTSIGYKAFYNKFFLTEVVVPESVNKIEEYAFADCKNLTTVTIKNANCHIDSSSFENCPISSFKFG